jgi:tetratricopeptide (TPR) repeat protein
LVLLHEAVRIDPEFAEAWALKMFAHNHLGEQDSAAAALKEALRHPERLTEDGQLFLGGIQDARNGDLEAADAKYRELIRRGYQLSSSLGNHAGILWGAGRYEEALDELRRAAHVSPFGPQQWVLAGEINLLLLFGHTTDARAEAGGLRGWYADYWSLAIAASEGEWARADSLAAAFDQDPTRSARVRHTSLMIRAAVASAAGAAREARDFLDHAQRLAGDSNRAGDVDDCLEYRLLLDLAAGSGGEAPLGAMESGGSPYGTAIRGLAAAHHGQLDRARQALEELGSPSGFSSNGRGDARAVLEAYVAGCEGKWKRAAPALAPWARLGERPESTLSPILVRWMAAQAFERSGQADSAAAYYELALDPTRLFWGRRLDILTISRVAHERLAGIHGGAGRVSDAKPH